MIPGYCSLQEEIDKSRSGLDYEKDIRIMNLEKEVHSMQRVTEALSLEIRILKEDQAKVATESKHDLKQVIADLRELMKQVEQRVSGELTRTKGEMLCQVTQLKEQWTNEIANLRKQNATLTSKVATLEKQCRSINEEINRQEKIKAWLAEEEKAMKLEGIRRNRNDNSQRHRFLGEWDGIQWMASDGD